MASTRRSARISAKDVVSKAPEPKTAAMAPPPPKSRKRDSLTPLTPQKRRARKVDPSPSPSPSAPPLATPTPANVGLIAESGLVDGLHPDPQKQRQRPRPKDVARLADPNATNAVLLSPETSRVVMPKTNTASTDASPISDLSPSKSKMPSAQKITTATLLEEACKHLISVDPRMRPLVEQNHCHVFSPEGLAQEIDPFESLCSGIISQQVSGAAAKSIKKRFVELFDEGDEESRQRFPHPSQVKKMTHEKLRTAGLSQRKAEYINGLAEKFASGELSAKMLADAPYEEVLEKLIAVRGLGRWSVEMFACFALKRMDVFSTGDLGVQRGMAAFEGRDVAKLKSKGGKWKYMSEKEMEERASRFSPYRSLFMWYMWRVEETDISTFE